MKPPNFRSLAFVGFAIVYPAVMANVADAQIGISIELLLPPPIVFVAPPQLVVLPGSHVYVAPDLVEDVYFVDGWWWRPWQGQWYRSQSYNSGWGFSASAPAFYADVNHGWRSSYSSRQWQGHPWDYQRMPQLRVTSNWNSWKSNHYWESNQNWGVPGMKGKPGHYSKSKQGKGSGSHVGKSKHDSGSRFSGHPQKAAKGGSGKSSSHGGKSGGKSAGKKHGSSGHGKGKGKH